jgi:hypothetical protein
MSGAELLAEQTNEKQRISQQRIALGRSSHDIAELQPNVEPLPNDISVAAVY